MVCLNGWVELMMMMLTGFQRSRDGNYWWPIDDDLG
jgi:hypothetical protein